MFVNGSEIHILNRLLFLHTRKHKMVLVIPSLGISQINSSKGPSTPANITSASESISRYYNSIKTHLWSLKEDKERSNQSQGIVIQLKPIYGVLRRTKRSKFASLNMCYTDKGAGITWTRVQVSDVIVYLSVGHLKLKLKTGGYVDMDQNLDTRTGYVK